MEKIVLFGHSFVREGSEFCEFGTPRFNLGLDVQRKPIRWTMDVVHAHEMDDWLLQNHEEAASTHLFVCDIGSNDVKGWFLNDGISLASQVFTSAIKLRWAGVRRVAIFPIMKRDGLACVPKRLHDQVNESQITSYVADYNDTVDSYNSQLRRFIEETQDQAGVEMLEWKGFNDHPNHLRDGLHLTDQYMPTYYNNLRRNVIRQCAKAWSTPLHQPFFN